MGNRLTTIRLGPGLTAAQVMAELKGTGLELIRTIIPDRYTLVRAKVKPNTATCELLRKQAD